MVMMGCSYFAKAISSQAEGGIIMPKIYPAKCSDCGINYEMSRSTYYKFRKKEHVYYCPKCTKKGERNANYGKGPGKKREMKLSLVCEDCTSNFTISKERGEQRFERYGKHLCRKCSRKGDLNPFFGNKFSEEKIQELSESKKAFYDDPELGEQRREEQSGRWYGENNPIYKGADLRSDYTWRHKSFRDGVLKRDGYRCQCCKDDDIFEEDLRAHHVNYH